MVAGRGRGWYRHGMQEIPIVLGFTAGELSPWLDARIDLQAYQRGAGRLCNFTVLPYGGIRRRRGTRIVDYAENQTDGATRLVPFRYSESDVLMLEFSPGTMRAFKDAWGVRTPDERDYYRLSIPWTTAEQIESLRFTQINDVLFVTCPTHPVVKISRLSNNNWTAETVAPNHTPAPLTPPTPPGCTSPSPPMAPPPLWSWTKARPPRSAPPWRARSTCWRTPTCRSAPTYVTCPPPRR